ncbi:MAG: HAD family phosphatase [Natronospirillum sp.]
MNWSQAKGLVFDMDGTLADSMPVHYEAWQAASKQFGFDFPHERFLQLGGVPTKQTLEILCAEQGLTLPLAEVVDFKEAAVSAHLGAVQPISAVMDIARWGHRQGIPMAVATGASAAHADVTLAVIGVRDWFGAVCTADDVTRFKPEPDVFLAAARGIGVAPSQCFGFEDTDIGILAIKAAGMRPFDVRQPLPALPRGADATEVSGS